MRASKEAPGFRFYSLSDKVWRADVLRVAWQEVRRNGGSAGVDGETLADIESYGVERWLGELARDLKEGTYRPNAVRQVLIPKKQRGKFRPLGIPCVRDRVAQTAAMLVLSPIFEADLAPEQYAYTRTTLSSWATLRPRICGRRSRPDEASEADAERGEDPRGAGAGGTVGVPRLPDRTQLPPGHGASLYRDAPQSGERSEPLSSGERADRETLRTPGT